MAVFPIEIQNPIIKDFAFEELHPEQEFRKLRTQKYTVKYLPKSYGEFQIVKYIKDGL